ncbi:IclR family transcriptional regulator [Brevibacillus choshinensis]|nr:IclR family transcriptional regulator [Brevibacillus choshinensis]
MKILHCFSFEQPHLSIEDIVEKTSYPKSTVYRLLVTLEKSGLIQYDTRDNLYRLGYKFLEFGGIVHENLDIKREAEPILSELHKATNYTVLLGVRQRDVIQYVLSFDSKDEFLSRSYVGRSRDLHYGALGIVLMSYMPEQEVKEVLRHSPLVKRTPYSLMDEDKLYERLKQVREQGFYVDIDETFVGFTAIAVPIFRRNGEIHDAIGIAAAGFKLEGENQAKIISLIKEAAEQISQRLGYIPHS